MFAVTGTPMAAFIPNMNLSQAGTSRMIATGGLENFWIRKDKGYLGQMRSNNMDDEANKIALFAMENDPRQQALSHRLGPMRKDCSAFYNEALSE